MNPPAIIYGFYHGQLCLLNFPIWTSVFWLKMRKNFIISAFCKYFYPVYRSPFGSSSVSNKLSSLRNIFSIELLQSLV